MLGQVISDGLLVRASIAARSSDGGKYPPVNPIIPQHAFPAYSHWVSNPIMKLSRSREQSRAPTGKSLCSTRRPTNAWQRPRLAPGGRVHASVRWEGSVARKWPTS